MFHSSLLFRKQYNHNNPETAIENYQTKSHINQAFDGKDNQEEDAISTPVQENEKNNKNNDKLSKNDYENVSSTAQPESSNGDNIH